MFKSIKKTALATVAAAVGAFGLAYAATAAYNGLNVPSHAAGQTATATWALGCGEDAIAGVSSVDGLTLSFEKGSSISKVNTNSYLNTTFTRVYVTNPTADIDENASLSFVVTPEGEFTPSNVSFELLNNGWGDGRYTVVAECGAERVELVNMATPARDRDLTEIPVISLDMAGMTATAENPLKVKIILNSRNTQTRERGYYLRNVVISGSYEAGGEPVEDNCAFTVPGATEVSNSNPAIEVNKCRIDNNGVVGYVESGATMKFTGVHFTKAGEYKATLFVDYSYGDGGAVIEVVDRATGKVEAMYSGVLPQNGGGGSDIDFPLTGKVSEGCKDVVYTFTRPSGFVANLSNFRLDWTGEGSDTPDIDIPAGWMSIPGKLDINNWTYNGPRLENNGANVGYVKNGGTAQANFFCTADGVYRMSLPVTWYSNPSDLEITVTDLESGRTEINQRYSVTTKQTAEVVLNGVMTAGKKSIKFTIHSESTGYLFNWETPTFSKHADKFAAINGVSIDGVEASQAEGYDYSFNLPVNYADANVVLNVASEGGTVSAKAGETALEVVDGKVTVPAPASNCETIVTLTMSADEDVYVAKESVNVRIFHLGDIIMSALYIDGLEQSADMVAELNNGGAAVKSDNVYTTLPAVKATFMDNTEANGEGKLEGTTAVYTIKAASAGTSKTYTVTVNGIHVYTAGSTDKTTTIRYNSAGNQTDGTWTDGIYTLASCNDGWGGTQFKMRVGQEYTLTLPADMKVKQLSLSTLFDNYSAGAIEYVKSGEATVYAPSYKDFGVGNNNARNYVVNFENHKAGEPITFKFAAGSQPVAWFDLIYEPVALTTAPVVVRTVTTDVTASNHGLAIITFDRVMNDITATCNGAEVKGKGGKCQVRFPVWDLPYNAESTLTIAAGKAIDAYGNSNAEPVVMKFMVGAPAEVEAAEPQYVVSNVDEWKAALAAVNASNKNAGSKRVVIFVKNGDYDFGAEEQTFRCHNVSVIGESREGVLLHGNRSGISNPVISTRNANNTYFQDLTIRNDLDFMAVVNGGERVGVGAAFYGGTKDIMRNVTLQSIQDTHVTGESGYYENCTIHGGVDYICGGGDHFFNKCTLVMEAGGYITAPSTSALNEWGYVFVDCVITGKTVSFDLGRPWQGEPRAYFINTVMEVLPNDRGWGPMGTLPTHFYEYNSMDKNGNPLDLSKRKNSSTSTNSYTPVLTAEEAAEFTMHNVLGSTDSWLPTEVSEELASPEVKVEGDILSWNAVDGASSYVIYRDGSYLAHTTSTSFDFRHNRGLVASNDELAPGVEEGKTYEFVVRAVNAHGSTGKASATTRGTVTGVEDVAVDAESEDNAEYYNFQGIKVGKNYKGACIRMTVVNGKRVATKIVK